MILTDDPAMVDWIKRARYEGRSELQYHEDKIESEGWNMYMTPEQATRGLMLMQNYPQHAKDIAEDPPYRDLREFSIFKPSEEALYE